MAGFDLVVLAIILVSILVGALRGFVYEVITLLGWVVAFFVARWFAPDFSRVLIGAISNEQLCMALAFGLIFIAVVFLNALVAFAFKALFSKSALRPADRSLGALFGIVRAGVCLLVLTLGVHILQLQQAPWWTQAKSSLWLDQAINACKPFLKEVLSIDEDKLLPQTQERLQQEVKDKMINRGIEMYVPGQTRERRKQEPETFKK